MEHIDEKMEKLFNNISHKQVESLFEMIRIKDKYVEELKSVDSEYMRLLNQLNNLIDTYNNKEDIIKETEKLIDERESIQKEIWELKREKSDLESDIIYLKHLNK